MDKLTIVQKINELYSIFPDFPWENTPDAMVFRHTDNRKWFALIMTISKKSLGINSEEMVDILNLKCDPILIGSLRMKKGFFPAYHMNKSLWITVLLDGSVDEGEMLELIELSYELTKLKLKRKKTD